jgi:hypothetical protein
MKRILRKFAVLLVTFVIGVGTYSVWHRYNPASLCDIEKHPRLYAGGEVYLHGVFKRTKFGIGTGCRCGEFEAPAANIELAPSEIAELPLPESPIIDGVGQVYLMDAVIVGQLDKDIGMGCFGPKYNIKNVRIERVISIREFEDSDKAIEWLKSNSY